MKLALLCGELWSLLWHWVVMTYLLPASSQGKFTHIVQFIITAVNTHQNHCCIWKRDWFRFLGFFFCFAFKALLTMHGTATAWGFSWFQPFRLFVSVLPTGNKYFIVIVIERGGECGWHYWSFILPSIMIPYVVLSESVFLSWIFGRISFYSLICAFCVCILNNLKVFWGDCH